MEYGPEGAGYDDELRRRRALPHGYGGEDGRSSRDVLVWVNLDVLMPVPETGCEPEGAWDPAARAEPGDVGSGVRWRGRLVCTGEVRGTLHRWERRSEGPWVAVVSYVLPLRGDPRPGLHVERAPIPAHAVRPVSPRPSG